MSPNDRLWLVGGGACTSVGSTLAASAAAVRAGIAAFANHAFVVDAAGQPMTVGCASYLPEHARGVERLLKLAIPAAAEAFTVLSPWADRMPPLPVVVGLPSPRPDLPVGFERAFRDQLQARLQRSVPIASVETIMQGHSAGLMALELARRQILGGTAEFVLVGGVDSYLDPLMLECLESCQQIHSAGVDNNAWGFVPSEAAGFCLVASARAAERRGIEPLGTLRALALAREAALINTEAVCLGRGLTEAFHQVFRSLNSPGERIDTIICDMNGEPYRADEFGFATIRTNEQFVNAAEFEAPADCWGDVGAASGPLFINLALIGHAKNYLQGERTLVWTSSESGERAATIIDFGDLLRRAR